MNILRSILATILLMPTFQVIAADSYTMYRLYKNPEERAVAIQQLQERWNTARAYIGEKAQAAKAYTQEQVQNVKEFATQHKQKLIAAGTAILILAALTLAKLGYDANARSNIRQRTIHEFTLAKMEGKSGNVDLTMIPLYVAYGDMIQGLTSLNALRNQLIHNQDSLKAKQDMAIMFDGAIRDVPGLKGALERLAKESPFEPILLKKN